MSPTLTVTRGLPGSGKTTYARRWVAEDPANRARINRDDIRAMAHDSTWLGEATERQIVAVQRSAISALLGLGVSVICDDTNLSDRTVEILSSVAKWYGAEFVVVDLRNVPLETCIERDAARPKPIGETVIRGMWEKHIAPLEPSAPAGRRTADTA